MKLKNILYRTDNCCRICCLHFHGEDNLPATSFLEETPDGDCRTVSLIKSSPPFRWMLRLQRSSFGNYSRQQTAALHFVPSYKRNVHPLELILICSQIPFKYGFDFRISGFLTGPACKVQGDDSFRLFGIYLAFLFLFFRQSQWSIMNINSVHW